MAYTFLNALQEFFSGNFSSEILFSIGTTLGYILIAVVIERLAWRYVKRLIDTTLKDEKIFKPVEKIVSYSMMFVLVSVVLYMLGFVEILTILGGSSLFLSLLLGFSMRVVLENFLAGIIIFISDEVSVGDRIKVAEFSGSVVERGLRYTIMKDGKGNKVKIPNSMLVTNAVVKYKK